MSSAVALVLSGVIGIVLGDSALYASMAILGPRRTSLIYALSSPIAALFAVVLFGEVLSSRTLLGLALVLAGVGLAVWSRGDGGRSGSATAASDAIQGSALHGFLFGLVAACGQAVGVLMLKPVLTTGGAAPLEAAAVRAGAAAAGLVALALLPLRKFKAREPATAETLRLAFVSGVAGMGIGITLQLVALNAGGRVAVIATLSSTTPVVILPLQWIRDRSPPRPSAWLAAALATVGAGVMYL